EGPQIWIDLGEDVAGEKAEPLSGLDRRPSENHARDLAILQGRHGKRHREIRLARAGWADPERHRARADGVDIALLRHRLRCDLLAAMSPDDVAEDVLNVLRLVERIQHRVDGSRTDLLPRFDELDQLVEHGSRFGNV